MGPRRTIAVRDGPWVEITAQGLARYPGAASPRRIAVEDYRDALCAVDRALEPGALYRAARAFPALTAEIAARGKPATNRA